MTIFNILLILLFVAFSVWLVFGPFNKRERARSALVKRGYCPRHLKFASTKVTDPEHPRCFSMLCDDCIPEYKAAEEKRLAYLMKTVSK